jgi:secondary thiamine-phosphate synthase enzyme
MVHTDRIRLTTRGQTDVHDLTERLGTIVAGSGVQTGTLTAFTPSSTSALTTIEFEPGAVEDLKRALEGLAPASAEYQHNLRWGDGNGHSHLRAALLGPSLSIPILEARLCLGTWQQVVYLDFDVRPRQREIIVQLIGEA